MEFTMGEMMFYGGIAGAVLCILIVLIAMKVFDVRRKKMLDKIMNSL